MSKYTDDELKDMATIFLANKDTGDVRCEMILQVLSVTQQLSKDEVLKKIEELACEGR